MGILGTGLCTIEHFEPRVTVPTRENDYTNCLLACRLCNTSRGDRPNVGPGGVMLLDPSQRAWGSHFRATKGRLLPRTAAARYTARLYNINAPTKVKLRSLRETVLREARGVLREWRKQQRAIASMRARGDLAEAAAAQKQLDALDRALQLAKTVVALYQAVPSDAPKRCRCGAATTLPDWVKSQLVSTRLS